MTEASLTLARIAPQLTCQVVPFQWHKVKATHMDLWHLRNKRFTPWHAIWRASEGRNRDSVRGDAGSACQAVARISKSSRLASICTPCHSTVAPSLLSLRTVHKVARKWHDNFVVTSRDTLENNFKFLFATWHALFHPMRISTYIVTSSSLEHRNAKLRAMA